MFEEGEKSAAMREAGAVACLTKTAPIQSEITAIHNFAVHSGL
jgi:hypothetical protein